MKGITWAIVLGLVALSAASAWADVVELNTGERIEGTFREATPAGVVIEVGGQKITLPPDRVRAIYFGAGAPGGAPPAPTASQVLEALKRLQSATVENPTYENYAARVRDTEAKIDRYLQAAEPGHDKGRKALAEAMRFHQVAAKAWGTRVTKGDYRAVGLVLPLQECPPIQRVVEESKRTMPVMLVWHGTFDEATKIGYVVSHLGLSALWSCASEQVADAERLLKGGR